MTVRDRYPEIDIFRGIAIVMMITFHTIFDLTFFRLVPFDVSEGFWRYFAFATASLFLLIVGVSLSISHTRAAAHLQGFALTKKFLFRGAGIFCLGLGVTIATWWYLREGYVIFGILHLIGVSVMLSPLFFRFRYWNAVIGIGVITLGWIIATIPGPMEFLVIGIHPLAFQSVDYEPIFPWFGLVLIGLALGEFLYPGGKRRWDLPKISDRTIAPLSFLGRHSLVIYLIHQPIILLLIYFVTGAPVL